MPTLHKTGFSGGCHWCTEAVFQDLKGVHKVEQGYLTTTPDASSFSEGVIVHYNPEVISLKTLIEIHLYTHSSTSNHSFRGKYHSAIYYFTPEDAEAGKAAINELQKDFKKEIITGVLPFRKFRASRDSLLDYYRKDPNKPFCKRYIVPKLKMLRKKFPDNY